MDNFSNSATASRPLDAMDRHILHILQQDGRISNLALARMVGLTPTPCQERVRRLERDGYIVGYAARLSPEKLGMGLTVFVQVTLDRTTPDIFDRFAEAVRNIPQLAECHMVAGGFDYLLKLRVSDMAEFRHILGEQLTAIGGVAQTHTYVVMEEIQAERGLPVAGAARASVRTTR